MLNINYKDRMLKRWLVLVFIILFFANTVSAVTPWWNSSFEFRQPVNISTNLGVTPDNYQIKLILNDTVTGANFNWSRNCNDIRIIQNQTKLNYWIENCNSTTNDAILWVKISSNFSTTAETLYMYYGNLFAQNESSGDNVFDFFDDFSTNLSKWTKHKSPDKIAIVNGYLQISGATTSSPYGHSVIGSDASYTSFLNGIIEGDLYLDTDAIAEIGYRGNYASNTGYKSRADARSSEGVSNLRPPYFGWGFTGGGAVGGGVTTHTWHFFSIIVNGNSLTITTQGKTKTSTDSTYNSAGEISFHNHYGLYSRYDNIRVRKYFQNNINTNYGAEESLGIINFYFISPNTFETGFIFKDDVLNVSVNISCSKKSAPQNCGTINLSLRYNDSATSFENISLSPATPLWITSPSQNCNLNNNQSCIVSWLVNGTGNAGEFFLLDVYSTSDEIFTFNQKSSDTTIIAISNKSIVKFNQSIYDFGNVLKHSGNKYNIINITSRFGDSTNVIINCESGDCLSFSDNFINGVNILNDETISVNFSCIDNDYGNKSAIYSVTNNENTIKSYLELYCNVENVYGPLIPQLNFPNSNTTLSVMQNNTFKINATVTCVGTCGKINALAVYNTTSNMWKDYLYNHRQNISITSLTPINEGYQLKFAFNSSNIGNNFNWSNSCTDIAFYTDYHELSFWVESCNEVLEQMDVWVRINDEINNSGYNFAIYYGYINSSKSNGDRVFDFFDDFNSASLDLTKWNLIFNQGWSVSGGELVGTNTNGILHSIKSFSGPIILESKTRMASSASSGQMSLGFYSSISNGIGVLERSGSPSQYNYRNGGAWSGAFGFDSLFNEHLNKISIDSSNNVELSVEDLTDGTISTQSFSNTVSSEYIALGRRYDNSNLNQGYNQRWDWIRTRMHVNNNPTINIFNEERINIISILTDDLPFYSFNSQPQTCNISDDDSCQFEWLINATGPINYITNISVLFFSNYSNISSVATQKAQIQIVNYIEPSIILYEPLNQSKFLGSGNVTYKFYVEDDSSILNCSLYINDIINITQSCLSGVNNTINFTYNSGYYKWHINVSDLAGNSIKSDENYFYIIADYSKRISKSIISENIGMYKINITINNLLNYSKDVKLLDFASKNFNYGSFNVIFDWFNNILGSVFEGTSLGWNLSLTGNEIFFINYSLAGVDDYNLVNNFVVGLD